MAINKTTQTRIIRDLASLMLGVAGESVSVIKRSDPERAIKLKPKDEWEIYLEFLKILFNLADRFSALYLPLKEQPEFMDSLEDHVADQLKTAMEPIIGDGGDPMEIIFTVGRTVAESRQIYESYRFNVVEEHKEKEACFAMLGGRVADAMGVSQTGEVPAASVLCVTAVVPAMKSLFEDLTQQENEQHGGTAASSVLEHQQPTRPIGNEIKLISVMATIRGEEIETTWGLHPQFRRDLNPQDTRELSRLMNRITKLLGERYAAVAYSEQWTSWHHPGHA